MEQLTNWLDSYQRYLDAPALLEALENTDVKGPTEDDPELFFQDLVSGVDFQTFTAATHNASFTMGVGSTQIEGTLQAIIEFCTTTIKRTGQTTPLDAAKLAEAYLKLGLYKSSEICTAVAFLLGNRSVETLSLLSGMAIREKLAEEAEEAIALAEHLHHERPEPAYYRSLYLLVFEKKPSAAIAMLQRLCDEHPDYAPGWAFLLDLCLSEKRSAEAVEYGEKAVQKHSLDPLLWERLAFAHQASGAPKESTQAIRMAVQRALESVGIPPEVIMRLQLETASFEEDAGFHGEAMSRYKHLFESGRTEPEIFLNAASCLKTKGLARQALDLLLKGIEIHENHPDILTNLGEILFEMKRDPEAFECLQKAAEIEPTRSGNLLLMAAVMLRQRKPKEALQLAETVARTAPERAAEAYALIGDVYRFSGAEEAARAAYEEARKNAPKNQDIASRISDMKKNFN